MVEFHTAVVTAVHLINVLVGFHIAAVNVVGEEGVLEVHHTAAAVASEENIPCSI